MKCDELKPLVFSLNELAFIDESAVQKDFENPHDHAVYKATEVDEAIAELKAKLVDQDAKNRRLKRSLYKACAMWANLKKWDALTPSEKWEMWDNVERKCRAKAEEYK